MSRTPFDNLLAIDTSGSNLRLGLSFGGDRFIKADDPVEKSHGEYLIKKIGELFGSAGIGRDQLDGIVVCSGPGSFTGLRVGMATAKGMAVALEIGVVAVSLFEMAEYKLRGVQRPVSVIVPLRKTEFALMRIDGASEGRSARAVSDKELAAVLGGDAVAGIGIDVTEYLMGSGNEDVSELVRYDAGDLIVLGREKLVAGEAADLARLEPLYLQKSQAEINFDLRNRS